MTKAAAMTALDLYASPETLPASDAARIGKLLGLNDNETMDDVALAERVSQGLKPAAAAALGQVIGMPRVVGQIIPEATLRRREDQIGHAVVRDQAVAGRQFLAQLPFLG